MYDTFIPADFDYNIGKDIEEINDDDNGMILKSHKKTRA